MSYIHTCTINFVNVTKPAFESWGDNNPYKNFNTIPFGDIEEDTSQPDKVIINVNISVATTDTSTSIATTTTKDYSLDAVGISTLDSNYISYYNVDATKISEWLSVGISSTKTENEFILHQAINGIS
tara:strand:+ start:496 stop:876 length:381 start_codon:yes stop_codon:yes gene_type:complete